MYSVGIPNWGQSDLWAQSCRKNQPASFYVSGSFFPNVGYILVIIRLADFVCWMQWQWFCEDGMPDNFFISPLSQKLT